MNEVKVWWPYNATFKYYHDMPLAGKRAAKFIEWRNQCKGGVWELHTTEQHMIWYNSVGKFLDNLKFIEPQKYEKPNYGKLLVEYNEPQYHDIGYV